MMITQNTSQDFAMPARATRAGAVAELRVRLGRETADFAVFVPALGRCFLRDPELTVTDLNGGAMTETQTHTRRCTVCETGCHENGTECELVGTGECTECECETETEEV